LSQVRPWKCLAETFLLEQRISLLLEIGFLMERGNFVHLLLSCCTFVCRVQLYATLASSNLLGNPPIAIIRHGDCGMHQDEIAEKRGGEERGFQKELPWENAAVGKGKRVMWLVVQAYMSGDVRCFNLLYESDVEVPIARRDARWQRAGISIRRPRHKDFRKLFNSLCYGSIRALPKTDE
jgi:hypothetical protein